MSELVLKVSEIFGPTFQGEGPSTGTRAAFIRLAGCNLHCSWCDTPYTWDWRKYDPQSEVKVMSLDSIVEQAHAMDSNLVVITGGEPLIQNRESLTVITSLLLDTGHLVEFETNGTQMGLEQDCRIAYNISPKLSHAGDPEEWRIIPEVLLKWAGRADSSWKFVVSDDSDEAEILELVSSVMLDWGRVWVMPEGQTPEELDANQGTAIRVAEALGCNYSDRLHIRLWGGKRGK